MTIGSGTGVASVSVGSTVGAVVGSGSTGFSGSNASSSSWLFTFDSTDFDITYTDFRVQIGMGILLQSLVTELVTNNLNILGKIENPRLTIGADSALTEHTLTRRSLLLNLTEERFVDYTNISIGFHVIIT